MDVADPNAIPDPAAYSSPPPSPSRSYTIIEKDEPQEVSHHGNVGLKGSRQLSKQ